VIINCRMNTQWQDYDPEVLLSFARPLILGAMGNCYRHQLGDLSSGDVA